MTVGVLQIACFASEGGCQDWGLVLGPWVRCCMRYERPKCWVRLQPTVSRRVASRLTGSTVPLPAECISPLSQPSCPSFFAPPLHVTPPMHPCPHPLPHGQVLDISSRRSPSNHYRVQHLLIKNTLQHVHCSQFTLPHVLGAGDLHQAPTPQPQPGAATVRQKAPLRTCTRRLPPIPFPSPIP